MRRPERIDGESLSALHPRDRASRPSRGETIGGVRGEAGQKCSQALQLLLRALPGAPLNVAAERGTLLTDHSFTSQDRIASCAERGSGDRASIPRPAVIELTAIEEAAAPAPGGTIEEEVWGTASPKSDRDFLALIIEIGEAVSRR